MTLGGTVQTVSPNSYLEVLQADNGQSLRRHQQDNLKQEGACHQLATRLGLTLTVH